MEGVKNNLDVDNLRNRAVSMPYPNIRILDLNNCVPVVVGALEEGDWPLIGTHNGVTKIIKRISNSALNVNKLLKVSSISISLSEDDSTDINSIEDYMGVILRWI